MENRSLYNDEEKVKDFRESCIGVLSALEIRLLDSFLKSFIKTYYNNVEFSMNEVRESLVVNEDYYGEDALYQSLGFDILTDLEFFIRNGKDEYLKNIVESERLIKEITDSDEFYYDKHEQIKDLRADLYHDSTMLGLFNKTYDIYKGKYSDLIEDEIYRR